MSDIGLPGQNGYDLLAATRTRSTAGAAVPAIALRAYAGDADRRRALAAGFLAHVPKPVDLADLVTAVHRCAQHAPQHRRHEEAR